MDNYTYIDLNTFEITNSPKGYIHCDKEIADIIATLNKKGYKTTASCAGHNEIIYDLENQIKDIHELDRIKNDSCFKIYDIVDDKIYVKCEIVGASTYITFDKDYNFEKIPKGFRYENKWLGKFIDYYNEDITVRRKDDEIENELKNNWCILREWANKLKYNEKEENDKYE